jgi:hypothetical protein
VPVDFFSKSGKVHLNFSFAVLSVVKPCILVGGHLIGGGSMVLEMLACVYQKNI